MLVLFLGTQFYFFRHMEPIIRPLSHKGHDVELWFGDRGKPTIRDQAIQTYLSETRGRDASQMLRRQDRWGELLGTTRELLGYSIYLQPGHTSPGLAKRFYKKMRFRAQRVAQHDVGRNLLARSEARRVLRGLEKIVPADARILQHLKSLQPDVIVSVTNLIWDAPDTDYLKAAAQLGIPSIVVVASWDNLTTKSTFHVMPDLIMVWNRALAEEAVTLHEAPEEKVCVTGAPIFDYLFDLQPSCEYDAYCKQINIPSDRPFIVYMGSSASIAGDETAFVRAFAAALEVGNKVTVVVRPHPINNEIWKGFSASNVVVYPPAGALPDTKAAKQEYFDMLYHSRAVVGINTSAMIEAVIVDKPCVTIIAEEYRASQEGSGHFQHLLRGGFLEIAHSFVEAREIIARLLQDDDPKVERRQEFVREFIRPYGLKQPAGAIAAKVVELVAERKAASDIKRDFLSAISVDGS